jgi:hypothetical protein
MTSVFPADAAAADLAVLYVFGFLAAAVSFAGVALREGFTALLFTAPAVAALVGLVFFVPSVFFAAFAPFARVSVISVLA